MQEDVIEKARRSNEEKNKQLVEMESKIVKMNAQIVQEYNDKQIIMDQIQKA